MNGKPHFELVAFPRPESVPPGIPDELFTLGVPRMGPAYRRLAGLHLVDNAGAGVIVCFGTTHVRLVGVQLATGHVVGVWHGQQQSPPNFINSNLYAFRASVQAAIARFPYHSRDAGDSEIDLVADELEATLSKIDPPAMESNCFWSEWIWDVRNGDYSTEDVIES